jgi:hypothetical protein
MTITNRLNLPEGFVKACDVTPHNKPGQLSATTLLRGTKEIILTERHWNELTDDAADRVWATFGKAVHKLMESEGADDFTEENLTLEIGGLTITGQIDNYNMKEGVVTDYKTSSVWKVIFNDFDDWKQQVKTYAWLLWKTGLPISRGRIIMLLKDHKPTEALRRSDYPQSPSYVCDFAITEKDIEETERKVLRAVEQYKQCLSFPDDDIPPCTAAQRWEKPTVYAVMKSGNKKAVKLYDNERAAFEHVAGDEKLRVEKRLGTSTKCVSYCLCKDFCNFYKTNIEPTIKDTEE